eukprot:27657-Eustigmatos_ZCMA.PRE.1
MLLAVVGWRLRSSFRIGQVDTKEMHRSAYVDEGVEWRGSLWRQSHSFIVDSHASFTASSIAPSNERVCALKLQRRRGTGQDSMLGDTKVVEKEFSE